MKDKSECMGSVEHFAHMEINGECPWCGEYNPDQTEFGEVNERGVFAADGSIIEAH